MAEHTPIEWTDWSLPIIAGCNYKSKGCRGCWAVKDSWRLAHNPNPKVSELYKGVVMKTDGGELVWTQQRRLIPERIPTPLRKKKGQRIFVCSQSDLFDAPDWFIDRVIALAALAPHHTLQLLTKEAAKMRAYFERLVDAGGEEQLAARTTAAVNALLFGARKTWGGCGGTSTRITTKSGNGAREPHMLRVQADGTVERLDRWSEAGESWINMSDLSEIRDEAVRERIRPGREEFLRRVRAASSRSPGEFAWTLKEWPLPNLHVGVTVEDQENADERIPELLAAPVGMRWISAEPLLGHIDLVRSCRLARVLPVYAHGTPVLAIDWVVAGGESGKKARPMHIEWARSLRDQCAAARIHFLFKQWGSWIPCETEVNPEPRGHVVYPLDEDFELNDNKAYRVIEDGGKEFVYVGKKAAGRVLDGQLHSEFPQ